MRIDYSTFQELNTTITKLKNCKKCWPKHPTRSIQKWRPDLVGKIALSVEWVGGGVRKINLNRTKVITDEFIGNEQDWFQYGRRWADQIFAMRQSIEKAWEWNGKLYMVLLDLQKMYERLDRCMV